MRWVAVILCFSTLILGSEFVFDLSQTSGTLGFGAVGAHYALSEPDVPTVISLIPIKVRTVNQKPPRGLQHPGADAFRVMESFVEVGGSYLQVYLQDIYLHWPYEKNPDNNRDYVPDDYLEKVRKSVQTMETLPYKDRIVYVPFNEPDAIWYGGLFWSTKRMKEFFTAWKTVYNEIKKIAPDAKIAGPNTTTYDPRFMERFLEFCLQENCLPDLITWHELNLMDVEAGHAYYQHLRKIEKELGIEPLPICINEYALGKELSVPGRLVKWLARLEQSRIDGCLAYWHAAGNFSGLVEGNVPNGAWWLFREYVSMSGELIAASPSYTSISTLAVYDQNTKTLKVLLGGDDQKEFTLTFKNVPFEKEAYYEVWEVEWSGYTGIYTSPDLLLKGYTEVQNSVLSLTLRDLNEMSAYLVVVREDEGVRSLYQPGWKWRKEAEEAFLENCTVEIHGGGNNPPYSGGKMVFFDNPKSALSFDVEVPGGGLYLLEIWYVNGNRRTVKYEMKIDDKTFEMDFPPTLSGSYVGKMEMVVQLEKGTHTMKILKEDNSPSIGIDRIDLRLYSKEKEILIRDHLVSANGIFEGDRITLKKDEEVEFFVVVEEDGYYSVKMNGDDLNQFEVEVNRSAKKNVAGCQFTVFLQRGVNLIKLKNLSDSTMMLSSAVLVKTDGDLKTYEAEEGSLIGNVRVERSDCASSGRFVTGIGRGKENALEMKFYVPKDGYYSFVIRYSNEETLGTHAYNLNVVDRYCRLIVDGQERDLFFRYTGGIDGFSTKVLYLYLNEGDHTVRFENPNTEVSPANVSVYGPNIDSISITPTFVE
ncbi:hypothetical protein [Thermotoga sp.]|uniref:GH39 family glycosyl hydrolase n=1 Tax=Thermotoga sp. TaxID=28240 RepID=UPI0025ED5BCB|nr:hypothetical protein [Thermotoga sp.]MCD6552369.1 hypothetical protein [Thermotoga sp.]